MATQDNFIDAGTSKVYINTGTTASPVYTPINCQTNWNLDSSVTDVDASTKCDPNTIVTVPIARENTVSFEGIVSYGDTGYEALETMILTNDFTSVEWKIDGLRAKSMTSGGRYFSFSATPGAFTLDAPNNDFIRFTGEAKLTGLISKVDVV